eukprot:4114517-Prymnesium_polylepis.1
MEINPYKFYYSSYKHLSEVAGVRYLPSRENRIHTEQMSRASLAQAEAFRRVYADKSDDWCQINGKCRKLARNFPTH